MRAIQVHLWGFDTTFASAEHSVLFANPIWHTSPIDHRLMLATSTDWTLETGSVPISEHEAREIGEDVSQLGLLIHEHSGVIVMSDIARQDAASLGLYDPISTLAWTGVDQRWLAMLSRDDFTHLAEGLAKQSLRLFESVTNPAEDWALLEIAQRTLAAWPGISIDRVLETRLLLLWLGRRRAEFESLLAYTSARVGKTRDVIIEILDRGLRNLGWEVFAARLAQDAQIAIRSSDERYYRERSERSIIQFPGSKAMEPALPEPVANSVPNEGVA